MLFLYNCCIFIYLFFCISEGEEQEQWNPDAAAVANDQSSSVSDADFLPNENGDEEFSDSDLDDRLDNEMRQSDAAKALYLRLYDSQPQLLGERMQQLFGNIVNAYNATW